MRYDIRNLNIWKDRPGNKALVRNQYKTISNKGKIYPIFLGDSLLKTEISCMNLSVRSTNCLHRRGWNTVGDIITNISSIEDIRQLRQCGVNSSEEIFGQIIKLQDSLIPAADQPYYDRIYNKVNGMDFGMTEDIPVNTRSIGNGYQSRSNGRNADFYERGDIICKILQM